jgi:predicted nucleic acid-binding protein
MPHPARVTEPRDVILVDTSIWIDHLHRSDPVLSAMLERDDVATHAFVIEEIALGSIAHRDAVLGALGRLRRLPVVSHDELMAFITARALWGRGLSAVDTHLLAATLIAPGARLWTRDKRLAAAAIECSVAFDPDA